MRSFGDQFGNSLYDKDNPDRADNQGRSQQGRQSAPRNQQGNRGNQQQSQPAQPAQPKDISVDQDGNEVLSGRALGFKNWVEFNGVEWLGFLENVLYAPTLAGYYESGGNPTGAIAAFRQHMADMGGRDKEYAKGGIVVSESTMIPCPSCNGSGKINGLALDGFRALPGSNNELLRLQGGRTDHGRATGMEGSGGCPSGGSAVQGSIPGRRGPTSRDETR